MTEAKMSRSHKEIRPSFESKVVLSSNLVLMSQNQKASTYSVVSIKRTGSLNYFEVFYHPDLFFFMY